MLINNKLFISISLFEIPTHFCLKLTIIAWVRVARATIDNTGLGRFVLVLLGPTNSTQC